MADAIRLVRHVTPETEFVVDNTSSGTSQTGTWGVFTGFGSGDYYGSNYLTASGGGNSFTWPVAVTEAGRYQLYARWTANATRSPVAAYTVHHAGGTTEVRVDQRGSVFDLAPASGHRVVLAAVAGGGVVAADAIRSSGDTIPNLVVHELGIVSPELPMRGCCHAGPRAQLVHCHRNSQA